MLKILVKKMDKLDILKLLILIIFGAASEPLLAYSYTLIGDRISRLASGFSLAYFSNVIGLILLALVLAGINYLGVELISNKIVFSLRKVIFRKILYKDSEELAKTEKAFYYNDILGKMDARQFRYLNSLISVLEYSLQIIFIILLVSLVDIRIVAILGLFLLPLIINNIVFPKKMSKYFFAYMDKSNRQMAGMKEYFDGIFVIKNNQEEEAYSRKMDKNFDDLNKALDKYSILSNISAFIANSGVALSRIAGIVISLIYYSRGEIDLGTFLALYQLTSFINEPVIGFINAFVGIGTMKEVNENLSEILEEDQEKKEKAPAGVSFKNYRIRELNYQYKEGEDLFKENLNIDFTFPKKYLLVGESGSGKSTLTKILLKYYPNYKGEVEIDGKSLKDISEAEVNRNIFYIPQDTFIFNGTVRENIDIRGEFSDGKIKNALDKMKLSYLYENEHGLDREIGQEVNSLSGGEAKRLYMAKAFLSDKNIIIADELLSNLDRENSKNVERLLLEMEDKTIIHISHNSNKEFLSLYDGVLNLDKLR